MRNAFFVFIALVCALQAGALETTPPSDMGIGLSQPDFEKTVEAFQKSLQDEMGFGLQKCPLKKRIGQADEMLVGRAIRQEGTEDAVVLVAMKDAKVLSWKQYELPGFTYWITRYTIQCDADSLSLALNGHRDFTYHWTGTTFTRVKGKKH